MIHVYMDDIRPCPKGFVLARTGEECLLLLEQCEVGILSLDHDMGWEEPNGFEIVKELVRRSLYPKEIYLHSSSALGRMNMFQHLYAHKPPHVRVHTAPMPHEVLERVSAEAEAAAARKMEMTADD